MSVQKMSKILLLSFVLISFVATLSFAAVQFTSGDACTIKSDGSPGRCVALNKCPQALHALQFSSLNPQLCGFEDTMPNVCCPEKNATASYRVPKVPGQISKQKCKEYVKYNRPVKPQLLTDLGELTTTRSECGIYTSELFLADTKAARRQFPHMVIIGFEPTPGEELWECGGSIISELYIMTAAHCLMSRDLGVSKYVRIGETSLNLGHSENNPVQKINIAERIAHPDYKPPSRYNDIESPIPSKRAIASAWHRNEFASDEIDLWRVTMDFVSQESCNESYGVHIGRSLKNGIVEELQFCAGSKYEDGKDTCQGDSGGPLQLYHSPEDEEVRCMYDIVGVASFSKACGIGIDSRVYTRVSNYIQWIESIVWP